MIDASRGPVPAWKRYATMVVLVALLLVAGFVIYSKEIKHPSSGSASLPAVTAPAPSRTGSGSTSPTTATTLPGGIQPSTRDPFSG